MWIISKIILTVQQSMGGCMDTKPIYPTKQALPRYPKPTSTLYCGHQQLKNQQPQVSSFIHGKRNLSDKLRQAQMQGPAALHSNNRILLSTFDSNQKNVANGQTECKARSGMQPGQQCLSSEKESSEAQSYLSIKLVTKNYKEHELKKQLENKIPDKEGKSQVFEHQGPKSVIDAVQEADRSQKIGRQSSSIQKLPRRGSVFVSQLARSMVKTHTEISMFPDVQTEGVAKYGLPNIGNTCFLNSVIQVLDSAQGLSMKVKEHYLKNISLEHSMHAYLGQVFCNFYDNVSPQRTCRHLELLIKYIELEAPHIEFKRQQDALDCLLAILDKLIEERDELRRLFTFSYNEVCTCDESKRTLFCELFKPLCQQCQQCGSSKHFQATRLSQYLIEKLGGKLPKQYIQIEDPLKKAHRYKLLSMVTYIGDGYTGHYYAYRKIKEVGWLKISDSRVNKLVKLDINRQETIISLYERIEIKRPESTQIVKYECN